MAQVKRFTSSVPGDLLDEFDGAAKELGIDRSRAVSLAMRNFLSEYHWKAEDRNAAGALAYIYDHEKGDTNRELTEVQHHRRDVIVSTTHVHIDERNCLEVVVLRGKIASIRDLSRHIMAVKGVKQARLISLSI